MFECIKNIPKIANKLLIKHKNNAIMFCVIYCLQKKGAPFCWHDSIITERECENEKIIINYIGILMGLALAAFGVVAFILPNGIMIGSATGIGRLIQHFYGIPVSYTVAVVNGLLFALGFAVLGKKFALSIVVSTFAYPMFINFFERLDFLADLTDNALLAAIYGGVLIGVGLGIVIKSGASTGGTDIVAIIFNRKLGIPVGCPCISSTFQFWYLRPFAKGSEEVLLGIMMTFLYSMVADKVVVAGGSAVQLVIISQKYEEIRRRLAELVVGNTVFYGESGYLGNRRDILLCVISGRELNRVQNEILALDPEAFMTINSVKEVKGRGFSFERGKSKTDSQRKGEIIENLDIDSLQNELVRFRTSSFCDRIYYSFMRFLILQATCDVDGWRIQKTSHDIDDVAGNADVN